MYYILKMFYLFSAVSQPIEYIFMILCVTDPLRYGVPDLLSYNWCCDKKDTW